MKLTLEEFYRHLPNVRCKGFCAEETCCEAAPVAPREMPRFRRACGGEVPAGPIDGPCPVLREDGSCGAYDGRPWICRLWGAEPAIPGVREDVWRCPHGCEIEGEVLDPVRMLLLLQAAGLTEGRIRSTNGALNRILDAEGALTWAFRDGDVAIVVDDQYTSEDAES